jgi:hypothetical protein
MEPENAHRRLQSAFEKMSAKKTAAPGSLLGDAAQKVRGSVEDLFGSPGEMQQMFSDAAERAGEFTTPALATGGGAAAAAGGYELGDDDQDKEGHENRFLNRTDA